MSQKFEIVIVGAGTAGMCCAIEAAQAGATVMVLEKDDKPGGALHWSGGHMSGGGTAVQQRNNITDSVEAHYKDIMSITKGTGDLDLIQLAVEEAPKTLNWLDELAFPWAPECPRIIYGHVPYTAPRTHYGVNKAISILDTILPAWNTGIQSGHIHCFYSASFLGTLQNNGQYDTVIYSMNGEEKSVEADHIVLTVGGYGSNPAYFKSKHGDIPLMSSAYPNATAEAMITLEKIGAQFRFADYHIPSLGGIELSPGRANFNEAWAMVLTSVYRQPRDIYINANGKRFMAEDEINADTRERIVVQQPLQKFWVVFDEAALMERDENGNENPIIIGWNTEKIKQAANVGVLIKTAPTLKELVGKMNVNAANFLETIDKYNDIVEQGADPDFGRSFLNHKISEAPFYAIEVHASVLVTFGGLKVNTNLELLDQENKPMKGLYGAGEMLGLGAVSGNAFCSGMSITPAMSFGRWLGQNLTR